MLENIYEILYESKIMYGMEVWALNKSWKEVDKIHSRFCKTLIGIPNCVTKGFAEMELGREIIGEASAYDRF